METRAHGALIDVMNLGVLLTGSSGIGKSECALELVRRGHRLVADDVVEISRQDQAAPVGRAPELIRHYMEIRGIGLLNIQDLYGPTAVRQEIAIELVCRLEHWREGADYERVGLDREEEEILGAWVPALVIPLRPSASLATLVEVAVRDTLQRRAGNNAARRLDARLKARVQGTAAAGETGSSRGRG